MTMIAYSTNWMGPINEDWIAEHGDYWAAGRIDIYGVPGEHYPLEYSLPPMHGVSWNLLSEWLWDLETQEQLGYDELIELFESETGHKIQWWED